MTQTLYSVNSDLEINEAGLKLIKEFEGLHRLGSDGLVYASPDKLAYKKTDGTYRYSIGYGHTGVPYGSLKGNEVISIQDAENLLKQDLENFEKAVRRLVAAPLSTNQFSALVSFTFSVGEGALARSTLLKLLNAGRYEAAAREFSKWRKAGGNIWSGLVRRRQAEKKSLPG